MFLNDIILTDQDTFTLQKVYNWRKNYSWATENPYLSGKNHFLKELSTNFWVSIIGNNKQAFFKTKW